jgi:electron transport complex protein RnfB
MYAAIFVLTTLGFTLGALLGLAAKRLKVETDPVIDKIIDVLPGTNCGQCSYPGCGQAAEALAGGEATVALCPPGGRSVAQELAELMNVTFDESSIVDEGPIVALVKEATCIGCTRCFKVCPTDAIVGAPKQIHSVIKSACTGCKACIDVCPTECLVIEPVETTLQTWHWPKPAIAA